MKKIIFILSLFIGISFSAQDSVIKKDGSELKVKITEISDTTLKYKKKGLSIAFSLNLSDVLLVTFENGERMTFNVDEKAKNNTVMLTAGTRIPLVMTETISSDRKGGRKVREGELITLTVQADVTDIDGNVLVKQGTLVNGTITQSVRRKMAGTKGKLAFSVQFIKAIDGQSIPVSFQYSFAGKSKTGLVVGVAVIVAAPLLLIKGKPAIVKEGTVFNALVVGDKKIKLQ